MKSKIFLITLSLIITVSLVVGATFAWFMDSETSSGNTFKTGTVDIQISRDLGDAVPGPMFYTTKAEGATPSGIPGLHDTGLWIPGKSITRNLDVRNVGSLAIRLNQVKAEITSINDADPSTLPAIAASFAQNFNVNIYVAGQPLWVLYNGNLADLIAGQTCTYRPAMAASDGGNIPVLQLCFEVKMNENAGNELQGIKPVVTFFVGAEQMANIP